MEGDERMFRCRESTEVPALWVSLYTLVGVGEVMEGLWAGVGYVPWVGDLTGCGLFLEESRRAGTCARHFRFPEHLTGEGGLSMSAGGREPSRG